MILSEVYNFRLPFCQQSRNQEATEYLQYLCSNDIDKPQGTIIHTGMHNMQGGYENDTSVIRLDEN